MKFGLETDHNCALHFVIEVLCVCKQLQIWQQCRTVRL